MSRELMELFGVLPEETISNENVATVLTPTAAKLRQKAVENRLVSYDDKYVFSFLLDEDIRTNRLQTRRIDIRRRGRREFHLRRKNVYIITPFCELANQEGGRQGYYMMRFDNAVKGNGNVIHFIFHSIVGGFAISFTDRYLSRCDIRELVSHNAASVSGNIHPCAVCGELPSVNKIFYKRDNSLFVITCLNCGSVECGSIDTPFWALKSAVKYWNAKYGAIPAKERFYHGHVSCERRARICATVVYRNKRSGLAAGTTRPLKTRNISGGIISHVN